MVKPGGHLLAFGGTRTYHRLACAIEDAGFEVRDMIAWLYGSGFPKHASCLKPAHEPVALARKASRYSEPLQIDACRITNTEEDREASNRAMSGDRMWRRAGQTDAATFDTGLQDGAKMHDGGRWPANVVLDEQAAAMLDEQTGERPSHGLSFGTQHSGRHGGLADLGPNPSVDPGERGFNDHGGASRFLYVAKASSEERNQGLEGFPMQDTGKMEDDAYEWAVDGKGNPRSAPTRARNTHPTVKPVELMRWLVRLVTPPGGTVLDPFTGSGTTGIAALREGFSFIGIEREAEYVAIARARIIGDAPLINSTLEAA